MTDNTFQSNDAQACSTTTTEYRIEMPCAGSNASASLSSQEPTTFNFGLSDIMGMKLLDGGMLLITFKDGQTLTIENFQQSMSDSQYQDIKLADGEVINLAKLEQGLASSSEYSVASTDSGLVEGLNDIAPAAGDDFTDLTVETTTTQTFAREEIASTQLNDNGQLVITFKDGTETIIENQTETSEMTLADGTVIEVSELLTTTTTVEEPQAVYDPAPPVLEQEMTFEPQIQQVAPRPQQTAMLSVEELAQIEAAAGDAPAGALGNTGAGFGSSVSGIGLAQINDVGPIGPTALQFGLPELNEDRDPVVSRAAVVTPLKDPIVITNDAFGFEDNAINFGIYAQPSVLDGSQSITVVVSNIPAGWTPDNTDATTANGVFNAANGTWTIQLGAGQTLNSGPVFTPPLNSDADINNPQLNVTVTQTDIPSNTTQSASGDLVVAVDAVADPTNLSATDVTGKEDNPVALNIQMSLTDATDGSEEITEVLIKNVPNGFTLNHGTNQGGGVWSVPANQVPNLELTPPANYHGTVTLEVQVTNEEVNFSGVEFEYNNNTNVNNTTFDVTFDSVPDAPSLVVSNPYVKEDGAPYTNQNVTEDDKKLHIQASLQDTDGSETLVVKVGNVDPTWTHDLAAQGFTYNAAEGKWVLTLAQGVTSFDGYITFVAPADSDVDMKDVRVEAISTEGDTGSSSEVFAIVDIIADAVADMPIIDGGSNASVLAGQSVALNITNNTTDTDGSETLGDVTISGLPAGYSLNQGTDLGNGVWTVTQAQLNGLMLNTPANGNGSITLTVSVTATETVTDGEIESTDNSATATDTVVVNVSPDNQPPEVTFGANGSGSAQVYEDGSIFVPITGTLKGNADQQLTMTLTGVPSSWTVTEGPNNGTYNSATGTWTFTLAPNTNYTGGLTFKPAPDSDVDLTGLKITATSENTTTNMELSTDTTGQVIVDAVADMPTIDGGAGASVTAGQSVALNITNAATDTDNSETLGNVTISGVPAGYSLNQGTDLGNGVWEVTQAQLVNLRLNTPANGNGNVTLTVSVTATEGITDVDFDNSNDTATNSDTVVISVNPPLTPPQVTFGANGSGEAQVYEDGSVFVPITGTLTGNATNQQLTVELTGIPSTWTITTGVNNGTYNAATGTWTITLAPNTNYTGGLTFKPAPNSDIDLTGLTVNAKAENLNTNEVETASTSGQVIVDAVADAPVLNVNNANGVEGSSISLNLSANLTDTDGSEVLSVIKISGLPAGFSLNQGTDLGNGVWEVTKAQLTGLKLNTPQNFSGTVPLTASVTSTEQVATDTDFDFNNNVATTTKPFNVVISDAANPPTLTVDGTHQVLEDGSVYVPFSATLTGNGSEILTVTVSNIDPSWTITGVDGTYNSATGVWTITMPAGQNYSGGLTFAPPANSDLDMNGIQVKANAFAPSTNTNSSVSEVVRVVTDAVADTPTVDAGQDASVVAGQSVALNITNGLTDNDGSEILGNVKISGVPSGYSLSAGTNLGNGVWEVTQAQLNGLKLNTPTNGNGNISLTVTTKSIETVTDGEFILSNNEATNSDTVVISVNPDNRPPEVTFGANGSGQGQVYEDNEVGVPITATLQGTADQQLTVVITGLDASWAYRVPGHSPSYDANTGTLTFTLAPNTNLNAVMFFTPPANSDVDLTGLKVTATATATATNQSLSSDTSGQVIVDAVADMPTLSTANSVSGEEKETVALNISTALTDNDGSEVLSNVTISGVPNGYSLTAGTNLGGGVWSVPVNQLTNIGLNIPNGATPGTFTLTVAVTSTEQVTDTDFDFTNNTATNTQQLTVTVSPDDVPVIITPSSPISYESQLGTPNVLNGQITVDFGSDTPGKVCVPQNGSFNATGSMASNTLLSGGVAVVVTETGGNTYVGKAGALTVFTLVVNANGSYTFTQYEPLDHASASDPNEIINLNFGICAEDSDGDMSVSTLTVRVQDTGPVARPDAVTMWSCDWVTRGNVITNNNQTNNGADSLSVEDPTQVVAIQHGGVVQEFKDGGDGMAIKGDHGMLFMFKNGSYAYVSYENTPSSSHAEDFKYTIADADGDRSSANLHVSVVNAGQTGNADADYGNQLGRGTPNYNATENGETDFYTTSHTDGAMVFGWTQNDELRGNIGDDVLLGWEGNDILEGMAGNDILMGEQGNNTLTGGTGADMFVIYDDKAGNNNIYDTITDFNLDQGDVLVLNDVISGFGPNSNINDFVRIVDTAGGKMVQVNTDGQGTDFYNVAKISNHAGIDLNSLDVQQLYDKGHIDVA